MFRVSILAAAVLAITAASASAAYLTDIQGAVLVNNHEQAGKEVQPGDRVKAVTGTVKIVYNNGAIVNVSPGQTAVVLANAPERTCPPDGSPRDSKGYCPEGGSYSLGTSATAGLAIGAAVAGGVGLAVALSNNSSQHASP